jgi:hypothetical protein
MRRGRSDQAQSSYNWGHAEDERAHHFGSGLQFMASQVVFAHAVKQTLFIFAKGQALFGRYAPTGDKVA